jgi:GTPase Era involved in 16S rRNA processing
MNATLTSDEMEARYRLLCRATAGESEGAADAAVNAALGVLQLLLKQDLMALAQHGAPPDFSDIFFVLEKELERLQELCAFPMLAKKKAVGFGGAFSAGKSSLINALLQQKLLAVEIDPTTSLPTYLLHGEESAILALNNFLQKVALSEAEFLSLTHDEKGLYGSNVGALLQCALHTVPDFPWPDLTLVDVPGYSKPDGDMAKARTDAKVAHAQLSAAQAIVWVVSVEAGGLSEEDLAFLASLPRDIPRLVVVSRADKREPESVAAVVQCIKDALLARNLPVLAVLPVSTRNSIAYPTQAVLEQLQRWNDILPAMRLADSFKRQFLRYERYLEQEMQGHHRQLIRIKQIQAFSADADLQSNAAELRSDAEIALEGWQKQTVDLRAFQQRFFLQLQTVCEAGGISQPEVLPQEAVTMPGLDLLRLLRDLHPPGYMPKDNRRHLAILSRIAEAEQLPQIMRRTSQRYLPALQRLSADGEASNVARLLRLGASDAIARILSF